jgi:hypothetical protein
MPFRPQDLHDLDVAREVRIETRRKDARIRSTVIWIVVDGGDVFVRSVRGESGKWYQEALAEPYVEIDDRGRRLEARAIPVHDADSIRRIDEALKRKYTGDGGFDEMFQPSAVQANLRLEPRIAGESALEGPAYLGADEPSELGPPVEVGLLDGGPAIDESVLLQPHKPV